MAVLTKTKICNLALSHLGWGKELTDVDTDTSVEASACLMYYDTALRETLRDFSWPFATKTKVLFWQEDEPTDEWGYAYQYPNDCIMIRKIQSGTRNDSRSTKVSYRVVHGLHTADRDGLIEAVSPTGSGTVTMDGDWTSSAAYSGHEGRLVTIYCVADESAGGNNSTITITGTTQDDASDTEDIVGATAGATVTSTKYWKTISDISIDKASSDDIEVGMSTSYGKEIYTDQANTTTAPVVEYTAYVGDPHRFDHNFGMAFSFKLASLVAPIITGGDNYNLSNRALEFYRYELAKAAEFAYEEEQPDEEPDSESILSRL